MSPTTGCGLSGNTVAALTCTAWPGCLMHQTWSSSCLLLIPLMQSMQKSPDTLMALSPPAIQLFSQTEVTLMMLLLPKQIPTSATKCMGRFKTSTQILLIWLPHVNATRGAQQHTACVHEMDDRSVASATPSLDLQPHTAIVLEDEPTLLTARTDGMVNSFNPVQLSAWRANVDMQYIVSRRRVI